MQPKLHKPRKDLSGKIPFRSDLLHWIIRVFAGLILLCFLILGIPRLLEYCIQEMRADSNIFSGLGPFLWVSALVLALSSWLLHISHRLRKPRLIEERKGMNYCLYLRSFNLDGKGSFNPPDPKAALFGLNPNMTGSEKFTWWHLFYLANPLTSIRLLFLTPKETAEEQLISYISNWRPVKAIGKPGDILPVLGAERIYSKTEDWQNAVIEGIKGASFILLQPGNSVYIHWEIEQALKLFANKPILLWLAGLEGNQDAYDQLRQFIEQQSDISLPIELSDTQFLMIRGNTVETLDIWLSHPIYWWLDGHTIDFSTTLEPMKFEKGQ